MCPIRIVYIVNNICSMKYVLLEVVHAAVNEFSSYLAGSECSQNDTNVIKQIAGLHIDIRPLGYFAKEMYQGGWEPHHLNTLGWLTRFLRPNA